MLTIDPAKVCHLIYKARPYDVKVAAENHLEGSDSPDDDFRGVLEEDAADPVDDALRSFVADLNDNEWGDVVPRVRGATDERRASYLLGLPILADYLEDSSG